MVSSPGGCRHMACPVRCSVSFPALPLSGSIVHRLTLPTLHAPRLQSPWFIDGHRKGESSVQEELAAAVVPPLLADAYSFSSAGVHSILAALRRRGIRAGAGTRDAVLVLAHSSASGGACREGLPTRACCCCGMPSAVVCLASTVFLPCCCCLPLLACRAGGHRREDAGQRAPLHPGGAQRQAGHPLTRAVRSNGGGH